MAQRWMMCEVQNLTLKLAVWVRTENYPERGVGGSVVLMVYPCLANYPRVVSASHFLFAILEYVTNLYHLLASSQCLTIRT